MSEDSDIRWEARSALLSLLQEAVPGDLDSVSNKTLDRVLGAITAFVDEEIRSGRARRWLEKKPGK